MSTGRPPTQTTAKDTRIIANLKLSEEVWREVRKAAIDSKESPSYFVEKALREKLGLPPREHFPSEASRRR